MVDPAGGSEASVVARSYHPGMTAPQEPADTPRITRKGELCLDCGRVYPQGQVVRGECLSCALLANGQLGLDELPESSTAWLAAFHNA